MSSGDAVTLAGVRAAAARLEGVAIRTPVVGLAGTEVRLKLESLQRTGAF